MQINFATSRLATAYSNKLSSHYTKLCHVSD